MAYLTLAYALALAIAIVLLDARINLLLSLMVPSVAVTILTFAYTKKDSRRELWGGLGLDKAGLGTWVPALVLPFIHCGRRTASPCSSALVDWPISRSPRPSLRCRGVWVATMGVCVPLAVVLQIRAKLWQRPPAPGRASDPANATDTAGIG